MELLKGKFSFLLRQVVNLLFLILSNLEKFYKNRCFYRNSGWKFLDMDYMEQKLKNSSVLYVVSYLLWKYLWWYIFVLNILYEECVYEMLRKLFCVLWSNRWELFSCSSSLPVLYLLQVIWAPNLGFCKAIAILFDWCWYTDLAGKVMRWLLYCSDDETDY